MAKKKGLDAISAATTALWLKVNKKFGEHTYNLCVNGLDQVVLCLIDTQWSRSDVFLHAGLPRHILPAFSVRLIQMREGKYRIVIIVLRAVSRFLFCAEGRPAPVATLPPFCTGHSFLLAPYC